jgi:hypothetical protein
LVKAKETKKQNHPLLLRMGAICGYTKVAATFKLSRIMVFATGAARVT